METEKTLLQVAARVHTCVNNFGNWSFPNGLLRCCLRQLYASPFQYDFRALKELCPMAVIYDYDVLVVTAGFLGLQRRQLMSKWLRCPSRTTRDFPDNWWLLKWFKNLQNSSFVEWIFTSYQKCFHEVDVTNFFLSVYSRFTHVRKWTVWKEYTSKFNFIGNNLLHETSRLFFKLFFIKINFYLACTYFFCAQ